MAGGAAWLIFRDRGTTARVAPLEGDVPDPRPAPPTAPVAEPPATARPARAVVEREAIGDGADIAEAPHRPTLELRVIRDVGADGTVAGRRLRDALISFPDVVIRYRSEAIRAEFLDASFRLPLPAYMPAEDPPGVPVLDLVDAVRQAGFDVVHRDPVVVIGPRTEPGQAPPPPPPPPPRPDGSPDGPR